MALTDNLVSHWKLDDASGDALDSHGSNTLTETSGTIASATGKIGNCRDFELGDTEYFSIADNAGLSAGDVDWTFACWINAESLNGSSGFPVVANKGSVAVADANSEWALFQNGNGQPLRFGVVTGTTNVAVNASTFGALSTGTWYFVVVWHDSVNNLIGISVNDVSNTAAHSGGVNDGNRAFQIGAASSQSLYWDGLIDEASFWKRVLTSGERTQLYNAGNGLAYPWNVGSSWYYMAQQQAAI